MHTKVQKLKTMDLFFFSLLNVYLSNTTQIYTYASDFQTDLRFPIK